eukprot:TRINITY_DN10862_c0_g2_i1.p2 TRINITY_DN10862_c0_g2~~TRINITY_DN10862_c0_g2_i1.p2  ORF type:complete len:215 (+),score=30.97 TRINITY_DN10862_c0_g2_i1:223-867(+)
MEHAKSLMTEAERIQSRIESIQQEMTSMGIAASSQLIDADGFPRSDVDVYAARHLRHELSCLQNDHKAKLEEVEAAIQAWHATNKPNSSAEENQQAQGSSAKEIRDPFLFVEVVTPLSPAANAKLLPGDKVVQFGSVAKANFTGMKDIAQIVQLSVGKTIRVDVVRGSKERSLELVPNQWSGRGLLGYVTNVIFLLATNRFGTWFGDDVGNDPF